MSKWLYTVGFALVLGMIGLQVYLLARPKPDPAGATIRCRAANAGIPLASQSAAVTVYRAGRRGEPIARGPLQESLPVPAGTYDVRVEYSASDDRQEAWIENLEVKARETYEGQADFSAGTLRVRVTAGRKTMSAGAARCEIYRAGDRTAPLTSKRPSEPALVAEGNYDVRIVLLEQEKEKSAVWLRDIAVERGVLVEKEAAFQEGALLITARNRGQALAAPGVALSIYRAGDAQQQLVDQAIAGEPLRLETGRYDVKAVLTASRDQPEVWFRGVEIRDGETANRSADFAAGFIKVSAQIEGGEQLDGFRAYAYVYSSKDHQQAITYFPAGETVLLSEGSYDVRVEFTRSNDRPDVWKYGIAVRAGQVAEYRAAFRAGRLIVRCLRAGKELLGDNVFVAAFAKGERRTPVAQARSSEELLLQAGEYDLRLRATAVPSKEIWVSGVNVRSGRLSEQSARID
jgi:hypothetical protein